MIEPHVSALPRFRRASSRSRSWPSPSSFRSASPASTSRWDWPCSPRGSCRSRRAPRRRARRRRTAFHLDALAVASIVLALSALPSALTSDDSARDGTTRHRCSIRRVLSCVGADAFARVRVREVAFWTLAALGGAADSARWRSCSARAASIGARYTSGPSTAWAARYTPPPSRACIYQLIVLHAAMAATPRIGRGRRWLVAIALLAEFAALMYDDTRRVVSRCSRVSPPQAAFALRSRALALAGAARHRRIILAAFLVLLANDQGRTIAVTNRARNPFTAPGPGSPLPGEGRGTGHTHGRQGQPRSTRQETQSLGPSRAAMRSETAASRAAGRSPRRRRKWTTNQRREHAWVIGLMVAPPMESGTGLVA